MKKLLAIAMVALVLTGCGGEKKVTTVCKGNLDEMTGAVVTIESTGDKTDVMKSTVTYDLSGYVSESAPIDTFWLPRVKSINVDYDSLKGGSAKYSVDGDKIILEVELDYSKADFDELKKANLVTTDGSDKKIAYISLEETIKEQEKAGLTCKEQ